MNPYNGPVIATSFADPDDVLAWGAAKEKFLHQGLSVDEAESRANKFGDSGIGFCGDFTGTTGQSMCALPPEDWRIWGDKHQANGRLVKIVYNGKHVIAELRDTMPHRDQIPNGAGIDLNPGALKALDLAAPLEEPGFLWRWLESPPENSL